MLKIIFRSASKSPYEILGLAPNSTKPEIKARYYELAKKLHPDLHGGNATKFLELNTAYNKIMLNQTKEELNPVQRQKRAQDFYRSMQEKSKKTPKKKEQTEPDYSMYRLYISIAISFFILYPIALYFEPKSQYGRPILVTPEEYERIMREEEEQDY